MARYISKIILHNFQGYKDETIVLKPGLNVLHGSSDSGKTSILRAISFVLYNYPRAKTLIHSGEEETRVTICFSDGISVTRILGDRNDVEVIDAKGHKKLYPKIDKTLPDEVKKALGNPPEDEFNGFISYADQFSRMFLVDLNSTDLSRSLSHLSGIEILEETAKELMSNYKSVEKQSKLDDRKYRNLLDERAAYSFLDEYESKTNILSKELNEIDSLQKEIDNLSLFVDDLDCSVTAECLDNCNNILNSINDVIVLINDVHKISDEWDKMQIFNLIIEKNISHDCLQLLNNLLNDIDAEIINIQSVKTLSDQFDSCESINDRYADIKTAGQNLSAEHKTLINDISISEKELNDYRQMLIDEKIQCESCGSILK